MSQAFHADGTGGLPPTAGAFPSQAKKSLAGYSQDGGSVAASLSGAHGSQGNQYSMMCFGCGGPHAYLEYSLNNSHIVICSNRNNTGVMENANRNIRKMWKNSKKHHLQNRKRKNFGMVNLANFDDDGQQCITQQDLQAMNNGHNTGEHSSVTSSVLTPHSVTQQGTDLGCGHGLGPGGGVILVADVIVLAEGSPLKHDMPILIQSNLPHITIQFGADLNCPNCHLICCAVNSCVALPMGNFHFFTSVVKCFPHCIAKIYTPEDYAPIILSGIVQSNKEAVTTKLEVGFLFHLPYRTRDGDAASLVVTTGPNISVTIIIGLPFMKALGMILDLLTKLWTAGILTVLLSRWISIGLQTTYLSWTNRAIHTPAPHTTSHVQKILQEVEHLKHYYDAKMQAGSFTMTSKNLSLLSCRTPCSQEDSFSTSLQPAQENTPIRVAPKPKYHKRFLNLFLDDRGYPDQSNNYDTLLRGINGGPILPKLKHPQPNLGAPLDPLYYSPRSTRL